MGWVLIAIMLFGQAVVAALIIMVLKIMLDRLLWDLARRQLECGESGKPPERVVLTTHRPLKEPRRIIYREAAHRRWGAPVCVDFQVDKHILGGAILQWDDERRDYSLRDRLRQAWGR